MITKTKSKRNNMLECKLILENSKIKEMTGQEVITFVPFSIDLDTIIGYRQSIDDDGELEDYCVIYTKFDQAWCIDLSYEEFKYTYKKYKDDSKTV